MKVKEINFNVLQLQGSTEDLKLIADYAIRVGWKIDGKLNYDQYDSLCFNLNGSCGLAEQHFWTCHLDNDPTRYTIIRDAVLNDTVKRLLDKIIPLVYHKKKIRDSI